MRETVPPGRLLAVDWGARRIGLALSDDTQTLAQPLATLTRRPGKRFPMHQLLDVVERHAVVGIVVGLPLTPAGDEGAAAGAARELAAAIGRQAAKPVVLWDERLSTARVLHAVRDAGGGPRWTPRERKATVDALAATVLLQHYLDARRGGAT